MFSFTPQAAQKLNAILQEKGGELALAIEIERRGSDTLWRMTLLPRSKATMVVDGVPVHIDGVSLKRIDGLIIDWVHTPEGPGLGVYDCNMSDSARSG